MKLRSFTPAKALFGAMIIGIALFGATQTRQISAQWNNITQPKPETTLQFLDETQLPESYTPGESQNIKFSFANQERKTTDYVFRVVATDMQANQQILGTGQATAQNNKIGTVMPSFKMPDMGKHVKISVELEYTDASGKKQTKTISYWVDQKPEAKSASTV